MANAEISIAGPSELEVIADIYNHVFSPKRDVAFFERRMRGRANVLRLIAEVDHRPVGFSCGIELKPDTWFNWLVGVLPDFRRAGIAAQLTEAEHAWARDHGYRYVRMECHNQHRPVLHMGITLGFDVVGVRWDSDFNTNLVIFEKTLSPADEE
jgi:GNAT superfamily N-acetyltransferase